MTRAHAIERARSATGHGCIYKLGQGGMKPQRPFPWDDEQECDCSGFAMWAVGLSRFDAETKLWYDTSRIWGEARAGNGLFTTRLWEAARLGDFLVYPDARDRNGHIAIVTELGPGGPGLMVDCGASNWREKSDAIQERGTALFVGRGIVAGYTRFEETGA